MQVGSICPVLGRWLAAVVVFWLTAGTLAEAKPIHLRGETIDPTAPANRSALAATAKASRTASGLYLIQFSGPLEPAQRATLRAAGVELLKYVPDDAFIAKLSQASPPASPPTPGSPGWSPTGRNIRFIRIWPPRCRV